MWVLGSGGGGDLGSRHSSRRPHCRGGDLGGGEPSGEPRSEPRPAKEVTHSAGSRNRPQ